MSQVFATAPGVPMVTALAHGILARTGTDPMALADVTVLLPTRRACRALRDAFLRIAGGHPLLLPRLTPLGDLDADELALAGGDAAAAALALPPAIPPLRRQLLLTRAIAKLPDLATAAQAARLADDLARLLDEVQSARLDFAGLGAIVPDQHAAHWQITLRFLEILTKAWPDILAEEDALDPIERRNRLLAAQVAAWRAAPPATPVIAAGSVGAAPAVAELLATVAALPAGLVVLPGLDRALDDPGWAALDDSHPQAALARLLDHLGLARDDVDDWGAPPDLPKSPPGRDRLLTEALRPAATTEAWRAVEGLDAGALAGLMRIDCADAPEEAAVIALLLRETLEHPGTTAALVTPDRALARRVASQLARWGIEIDDSAGVPLGDTPVGALLRLVLACGDRAVDPVSLLALAKHPLVAGGIEPERFRARARFFERAVLRGPRPAPGFDGLRAALDQVAAAADPPDRFAGLARWLDALDARLGPLVDQLAATAPLVEPVRSLITVAEALAAPGQAAGADRLWRGDDGEAAAAFLNDLLAAAGDYPPLPGREVPALIETLMAGVVVRPRYGRHPRLAILGPLEGRLLAFDRLILGGLNEGGWPAEPPPDPWLSRPMRRDFGLADPDARIGLAAHDFQQFAAAPEVVLTRAAKVEGAPTVPSRWLLRLDAVLDAAGLAGVWTADAERWRAWARQLDTPVQVRAVARPAPRPPVAARPRRVSVTEVETWMRNPYAIYAKRILALRPLDPIAADPGAAERGQVIHAALDRFVRLYPDALPDHALDELLRLGHDALGDLAARPEVWGFWWPRFERIARWFLARERERRPDSRPLATEVKGALDLALADPAAAPFRLTATADRIDLASDGTLTIIDYKTGSVPRDAELDAGLAPQLPLEAAIAAAGGFAELPPAPVGDLAFWRLSGGDPPGEIIPVKAPADQLAGTAEAGLKTLIAAFDRPDTPYLATPRPEHAPRFDDYDHLARTKEWSAGERDDEG